MKSTALAFSLLLLSISISLGSRPSHPSFLAPAPAPWPSFIPPRHLGLDRRALDIKTFEPTHRRRLSEVPWGPLDSLSESLDEQASALAAVGRGAAGDAGDAARRHLKASKKKKKDQGEDSEAAAAAAKEEEEESGTVGKVVMPGSASQSLADMGLNAHHGGQHRIRRRVHLVVGRSAFYHRIYNIFIASLQHIEPMNYTLSTINMNNPEPFQATWFNSPFWYTMVELKWRYLLHAMMYGPEDDIFIMFDNDLVFFPNYPCFQKTIRAFQESDSQVMCMPHAYDKSDNNIACNTGVVAMKNTPVARALAGETVNETAKRGRNSGLGDQDVFNDIQWRWFRDGLIKRMHPLPNGSYWLGINCHAGKSERDMMGADMCMFHAVCSGGTHKVEVMREAYKRFFDYVRTVPDARHPLSYYKAKMSPDVINLLGGGLDTYIAALPDPETPGLTAAEKSAKADQAPAAQATGGHAPVRAGSGQGQAKPQQPGQQAAAKSTLKLHNLTPLPGEELPDPLHPHAEARPVGVTDEGPMPGEPEGTRPVTAERRSRGMPDGSPGVTASIPRKPSAKAEGGDGVLDGNLREDEALPDSWAATHPQQEEGPLFEGSGLGASAGVHRAEFGAVLPSAKRGVPEGLAKGDGSAAARPVPVAAAAAAAEPAAQTGTPGARAGAGGTSGEEGGPLGAGGAEPKAQPAEVAEAKVPAAAAEPAASEEAAATPVPVPAGSGLDDEEGGMIF